MHNYFSYYNICPGMEVPSGIKGSRDLNIHEAVVFLSLQIVGFLAR